MINFHPDFLAQRLADGLPGPPAQQKMAPSVRFDGRQWPDESLSKESSVLIPLFRMDNGWSTLLIERTSLGPHGGQISFPGGKRDPGDENLMMTALREAEEEVGLPPSKVKIVGQLTRLYVPNSNFWIYPFIGLVDDFPDLKPNPEEVACLLQVRIDSLFDPCNKKSKEITRNGTRILAPYYDVRGHFVWGATAMILSELETLIC